LKNLTVKPGDIIVSNFDGYQHWSIVTDGICDKGQYKVISATKRNNTVQEEPADIVTQGKKTYVADIQLARPVSEMLAAARSQVGKWSYSLNNSNCEHFVRWAAGLEVTSTQVNAGVAGAVVGASLVGTLSENPKVIKLLGAAFIVAGLAVFAARALEKEHSPST